MEKARRFAGLFFVQGNREGLSRFFGLFVKWSEFLCYESRIPMYGTCCFIAGSLQDLWGKEFAIECDLFFAKMVVEKGIF